MVEQHIVFRKVITVKVCELQLILKSVKKLQCIITAGDSGGGKLSNAEAVLLSASCNS